MHLLVGLGNPGEKYAGNRHNIGFMVLEAIAREYGFAAWRKRFRGVAAEGTLAGARILALKPLTFMNNSGRSVGEAWRFHRIERSQVIVLHDEMDLELGKVRVKLGGGHGGHNGIRDIANQIGPDFVRARIGIGHPGEKARVHGHVLKDFSKAEQADVDKLIHAIGDNIAPLLAGDRDAFMNKVALVMKPPRPNAPRPKKPEDEAAEKPAAEKPDDETDTRDDPDGN